MYFEDCVGVMPSTGDWWRPLCAFEKEPVPTIAVCGQESSRCHREGRLGKWDLHRAVIAGIPELQNLQEKTWVCCQYSDVLFLGSAALGAVCVSCTWSVALAQAAHQSGCSPNFTVHRLELCAASPPAESRLQWEQSGAFLWQPVLPALPAVCREDQAGAPAFQWSIAGYFKEEEIKVREVTQSCPEEQGAQNDLL